MTESREMPIPAAGDDPRWSAVERRQKGVEGSFFYAVRTTGVYCRPGCSSRPPKRSNVVFFESRDEARAAGFRACKKCRPDASRPDQEQAEVVRQACRAMERAEEPPALKELAGAAGLSLSHFHRLFKRAIGVTPRAYAAMKRVERVRSSLLARTSVTQAIYDAGYGASSRFYAEAGKALGMTPKEFRTGARGLSIRVAVASTYLGRVLVAATERGICAIDLGGAEGELRRRLRNTFPGARFVGDDWKLGAWVRKVVAFLEAPKRGLSLPLDIQGTAFQRRVWEALRGIPAGRTLTYAQLAARIGAPKAVRAVGRACASNSLAVAVPCHRVVRSDGGLSGYRWGVARKQKLLEREGAR